MRNVKADTHHGYAGNKQKFVLALKGRIFAAAMTILEMNQLDGQPPATKRYLTDKSKAGTHAKSGYLKKLATEIVDRYIIDSESHQAVIDSVFAQMEREEQQLQMTADGRFPFRHAGCNKTFRYMNTSQYSTVIP